MPRTDLFIQWAAPQFEFVDRYGSRGQRGLLRAGRELVVPVIRSLDDDDAVLGPGLYKVVMELFASKERRTLMFRSKWDAQQCEWGPDFAHRGLAIHDFGSRSDGYEISGFPKGLDGCAAPGLMFRRDGVALPVTAMKKVFEALGGWKRWSEFRLQILP